MEHVAGAEPVNARGLARTFAAVGGGVAANVEQGSVGRCCTGPTGASAVGWPRGWISPPVRALLASAVAEGLQVGESTPDGAVFADGMDRPRRKGPG